MRITEENKHIAEEMADKICSIALWGRYRPDIAGSKEAQDYMQEYMSEVYWKLVDFDEEVIFITASTVKKLTVNNKRPFFNGTYVKIWRRHSIGTKYRFYVYCSPISKLKTAYIKARENGFFQ